MFAAGYQSPEQVVNSHDVDIRTDIYALGAILYFLLTGKPPFSTHALLRLAAGVVTHPQPLAQLRPDLPGNRLCTQCHAKIGAELTSHTHHAEASAGSQCVECHMPRMVYGILESSMAVENYV